MHTKNELDDNGIVDPNELFTPRGMAFMGICQAQPPDPNKETEEFEENQAQQELISLMKGFFQLCALRGRGLGTAAYVAFNIILNTYQKMHEDLQQSGILDRIAESGTEHHVISVKEEPPEPGNISFDSSGMPQINPN